MMANKRFHLKQLQTLTVFLSLYLYCCMFILPANAEIRSRGANSVNTSNLKNKQQDFNHLLNKKHTTNDDSETTSTADSTTTTSGSAAAAAAAAASSSAATTTSSRINTDFVDKLSWKCANNASCLYSLASGIFNSYRRGETVKLGFMDLVKLPKPSSTHKTKSKPMETGRSMSQFVDFISGNAIRIPVGPMVFSVQRAEDDDNYIEIALLKKATSTARLGDGGGGGGGGGGGHHGIIQRIKEHKDKDDKKQMQMYIPMYLAATTFGWTMVAAKAVGFLTLKALAISKLAFIVAAMVLMKKLMENASEKMMYQYPEQSPYMMPYSMDYGMHSMAAAPPDMATAADLYGGGIPLHAAVAPMQGHQGHPGFEHLTAESSIHQNIADVQNNTQVLAALNAVGLGAKVKREDNWLGRIGIKTKHFAPPRSQLFAPGRQRLRNSIAHQQFSLNDLKSYNDFASTAAAVAAAEIVVEENEKRLIFKSDFFGGSYIDDDDETEQDEMDDVFNSEESIKETLQFLAAAHAARRPMVYNYLNPHTAYYRQ